MNQEESLKVEKKKTKDSVFVVSTWRTSASPYV